MIQKLCNISASFGELLKQNNVRGYATEIEFSDLNINFNSKAKFSQMDCNTDSIAIQLKNEATPMILTEETVIYANIKKPDGKIVTNPVDILDKLTGTVILRLKSQSLDCVGTYSCELVLKFKDGAKLISPKLNYDVFESYDTNNNELSQNSKTAFDSVIETAQCKISEINSKIELADSTIKNMEQSTQQHAEKINKSIEENTTKVDTCIRENTTKVEGAIGELKAQNENGAVTNSKLTASIESAKNFVQNLDSSQNLPKIREDLNTLQNGLKSNQTLAYEGHQLKCENTFDGRTEDIVLEGMTYQNLINTNIDPNKIYTIDKTTNPNDRIYSFDLTRNLEPNKTYTLIFDVLKYEMEGSQVGLRCYCLTKGNGKGYCTISKATGKTIYKLTTGDWETFQLGIYIELEDFEANKKVAFSNLVILEGDYTQPNSYIPNYFEGIKSVGEREKNLCEFLESGGIIYAGGQNYPNDQYCRTSYIPVEKGKNYSVSPINLPNLMKGFGIYYYSKNKEWIKNLNSSTNASYFTASATGYVRLEFKLEEGNHVNTEQLSKIKMQVNEGKLLSYIPPNKNKIYLITNGKNLVNLSKTTSTDNQSSIITNVKTNEITIESNEKKGWIYAKVFEINTRPNTKYEVGCKFEKLIGGEAPALKLYGNTTNEFLKEIAHDGTIVFNSGNNTKLQIYLYTIKDAFIEGMSQQQKIRFYDITLSQHTNSSYTPYEEETKEILLPFKDGLKGLPNGAKDLIYNKDDGCYVQKNINKVVISGLDEEWTLQSINVNGFANFHSKVSNYKQYGNTLCNRFLFDISLIAQTIREGFHINENNDLYIRIDSAKASTVESFKKWLQDNPVEIYYELATPVETKISNTKISLDTYNLLTYLFTDNTISPNIKLKVASNLGSIIQQNAKSINDIYRILDELVIPQLTENTMDIALLKN